MTTSKQWRLVAGRNVARAVGLNTQRAILGSLVLCAALCTAGCGGDEVTVEPALRPVRTERVERIDRAFQTAFAGVAKQGTESWLSFRVAGALVERPVNVGDAVRRGAVLARLDPTDYETAVEYAKAGLAQANATFRRYRADYNRARALYENSNASRAELDAARAAWESGKAQVAAAQQELETRSLQLGYTELTAPSDGVVAEFDGEVNENLSAGQKVVLLTAGARPEVDITVPEVMISRVSPGQSAVVEFDAVQGRSFAATVSEIGIVASGSAAYSVTVRLEDAARQIRSGMAASVTLRFRDEQRGSAIFVRPVAVGEDQDGTFVFVLEPQADGTAIARRRSVGAGMLSPLGMEILSGLDEGELIATAGVRRLIDGLPVKLAADEEAGS